jgi:hypothetical protein
VATNSSLLNSVFTAVVNHVEVTLGTNERTAPDGHNSNGWQAVDGNRFLDS